MFSKSFLAIINRCTYRWENYFPIQLKATLIECKEDVVIFFLIGHSWPFFIYFQSFQTKNTICYDKLMWKNVHPVSGTVIQAHNLLNTRRRPEPLGQGSRPILSWFNCDQALVVEKWRTYLCRRPSGNFVPVSSSIENYEYSIVVKSILHSEGLKELLHANCIANCRRIVKRYKFTQTPLGTSKKVLLFILT